MAASLQKIPESLYNSTIAAVVKNYSYYEKDVRTFQSEVIFDVYYKLCKSGLMVYLGKEFEMLDQFEKILKVRHKRNSLHNCFQALMDNGIQIALRLSCAFTKQCMNAFYYSDSDVDRMVKFGFELGMFLADAGWFVESESVYLDCLELCCGRCVPVAKPEIFPLILECYERVLHVQNKYCKTKEALHTFKEAEAFIEQIKLYKVKANLAGIYSEFSSYHLVIQFHFTEAYTWSVKAIQNLDSSLPYREIVNILCTATRACFSKLKFQQAELLIKQAVGLARERFENENLVVANVLKEYGDFLTKNDSVQQAVKVYQKALDIRINVLGGNNLLVAIAHEDLAYASYAAEYNSGSDFSHARDHIEEAYAIKTVILEPDNIHFHQTKRIYALILEEIGIDSNDKEVQRRLYAEAEEFHTFAIQMTKQCLGELTMQTGKHYGNLGRLYDTMKKFKKSKKMHQRAIAIKKAILGPDNYEVAISMGNLAALYGYKLKRYREAEKLYSKSVNIALKQFGRGYSGLGCDYRGLLMVYSQLGDVVKASQLQSDMREWELLRDQILEEFDKTSPLCFEFEPIKPENIYEYFLNVQ